MLEIKNDILSKFNELRQNANVQTCKLDDRLTWAAQKHADDLLAHRARPHDGFPNRVYDTGFEHQECGNQSGFGNTSEGVSYGTGAFEPSYLMSILNDNGGHGRDFRDPVFNLLGIGYAKNENSQETYLVLDYGCLCKGDRDEKKPRKLTEMDFSAFQQDLKDNFKEKFPTFNWKDFLIGI